MSDMNITVYGTRWCGDCKRAVKVLNELQWPYTYIDIEQDDQAAAYVRQVNNGNQSVPTITFPDGTTLTEPSSPLLRQKLETLKS